MIPFRIGVGFSLLLVLCLTVPAGAQTVFDIGPAGVRHGHDRFVVELPLGGRHHGHNRTLFPAGGFRYPGSYSLVYLVNVLPGEYCIALSCPAASAGMGPAVSIFDRWPHDSSTRRIDLPMGPAVRSVPKKLEYRWNVGVSPRSTSTQLYICVEVPRRAHGAAGFPHSVAVMSPASYSAGPLDRGVIFLSGPTDLVLTSGPGTVSYVVERPEKAFDTSLLPVLPIQGDLVKNGSFIDGLNHWTVHRNRTPSNEVETVSLQDKTLRITGTSGKTREGVMQKIDSDVSGAASLILRADFKVTEQTSGGTGPGGSDAPIAIAIGYSDSSGREVSKDLVFWKGFYALPPEEPAGTASGQKVPKGAWYRYIFDLMQLDPKPAAIRFISLEGSGLPAREGWAREVHLIRSGGEK